MTYEELQENYPWLFVNPDGCPIRVVTDRTEREAIELSARDRTAPTHTGILHSDRYVVLLRDAVTFAGGETGTYLRFYELPLGSANIAVLPKYEGNLVLIRQFRHATRTYHIEIPRGFPTSGPSEDNARKELAEEIGATCSALISLGHLYTNTGLNGSRTNLFFARIDRFGAPAKNEGIVEILQVSTAKFEQMIAASEITDSFTIACYARAKLAGLL